MRRPTRFAQASRRSRWVQLWQVSLLTVCALLICGMYAHFLWRPSARRVVKEQGLRTVVASEGDSTDALAVQEKLWLTIGIPTVPRRNDMDYLLTTVETLLNELPSTLEDPLRGKIRVIIMNNKKGQHVVFERAKQLIHDPSGDVVVSRAVAASHMDFIENPGDYLDPFFGKIEEPNDLDNPSSRPGSAVRQQTCDLITLMDEALKRESEYYMFMEDDFRTCGKALKATHYAIGLANEMSPSWLAMRLSYGMNGIVMRSRDLPAFSEFLKEHLARLPPDLLWTGYLEGHTYDKPDEDTRVNRGALMVFKHNLFDHIGTVSSFEVRPDRPKWPGCYESMSNVWSLQEHERFDRRCDEFDISPCIGLTMNSKAALIYKGGHFFEPP